MTPRARSRSIGSTSIVAAAKTGTAQRGEGLVNNAMFILYAPYGDNPEIAIAIAVEKAARAPRSRRSRERSWIITSRSSPAPTLWKMRILC